VSFKENEGEQEKFVDISLEDSVLLLLAEQRIFTICRRDFFCPEKGCHPNKSIPS
jgi:hypothetical protein